MLTNTGKNILAKYLIGQAPAYASYIAFGCGPSAIESDGGTFGDYSNKTNLDFEMFRSPIVSRGYVTDTEQATITNAVANGTIITYTASNRFNAGDSVDITGVNVAGFNIKSAIVASATASTFTVASSATGTYTSGGVATKVVSSIVFTAQLPTEERYEITEIGVYSAGSNPSAGPADSRTLYSFSRGENWEYHQSTGSLTLTEYSQPLDKLADGTLPDGASLNSINVPDLVFQANADNALFESSVRVNRNERSRFLNNMVLVRGDAASITGVDNAIVPSTLDGTHIHLNGISLSLDKNSGQDEIRLAMSVINKDTDTSNPSDVKIIVDFVSSDDITGINQQYARMRSHLKATPNNFNSNRYFVVSSKIEDLEKSQEFSWRNVSAIKIFVSIPAPTVDATHKEITDNVATITLAAEHDFGVGGRVTISGVGAPFDGVHKISAVSEDALTLSYPLTGSNVAKTAVASGSKAAGYSSKYYVGLDSMRVENTATINPLYGLVGYTVAKTASGNPIVKETNTSSLLEFRFAMDVM
jgi:hypothetical protein